MDHLTLKELAETLLKIVDETPAHAVLQSLQITRGEVVEMQQLYALNLEYIAPYRNGKAAGPKGGYSFGVELLIQALIQMHACGMGLMQGSSDETTESGFVGVSPEVLGSRFTDVLRTDSPSHVASDAPDAVPDPAFDIPHERVDGDAGVLVDEVHDSAADDVSNGTH